MDYKFITTSFIIMFASVIGISVLIVVSQWIRNHRSPRIVTQATVLDKRVQVQHIRRKKASGIGYATDKMPIYYVLFEIEGGEKLEFLVNKVEYSKVKNNQSGRLTFQGSKFIRFEK